MEMGSEKERLMILDIMGKDGLMTEEEDGLASLKFEASMEMNRVKMLDLSCWL